MASPSLGVEEGVNFRSYRTVRVDFLLDLPSTTREQIPPSPGINFSKSFEIEINLNCTKNETTKSTNSYCPKTTS